jgi:hypothetical protein
MELELTQALWIDLELGALGGGNWPQGKVKGLDNPGGLREAPGKQTLKGLWPAWAW